MQRTDAPTQALLFCLLRRWWCMLPDTLWCVVLLRAPDSLPHVVQAIERVRLLHRRPPHSELPQTLHGNNSHRWYDKLQFNVDASACRPIYSSARAARLLSSASCSVPTL